MTIKERLELDAAIEMKRAQCAARPGLTPGNSDLSIIWEWKRDNPDVTMIYQWRGTPKGSTNPEDYFYPGQGAAQQSLFKQVIQFDRPDSEPIRRAA